VTARPDASLSRRRFLLGGLGGMTVLALGPPGAAGTSRRGPRVPSVDEPTAGPRVDVHSRLFNGQDVSLAGFLGRVVAPDHPEHAGLIQAGAGIAQALGWALAPSGATETWRLETLARRHGPALGDSDDPEILRDRREAERRFRDALPVVLSGTEFFRLYLERLMPEARPILGRAAGARLARMAGAGALDAADVDFLLGPDGAERALLTIRPLDAFRRYTYYRYLTVSELLRPDADLADLVVPTVAVFDGAPGGSVPPTPPRDQQVAMARLVTLCGGRLHPLAPFDPRGPADAGDALARVRNAVEHHGFVGVTLSAPPTGAATSPPRLRALLDWCAREEVAVVMPGGSEPETAALLDRHPGLRIGVRTPSREDLAGSRWRDGSPMHGLDWMRRSIEGSARDLHRVEARAIATAVRGGHAADFLGLRRGRRSRERLERFYDRQRMAPPAWMQALDAPAPGRSTSG
jgi:hypothetical protein